jgi:hypothetical protein
VVICGLRLFAYYSIEYFEAFGREFADMVTSYVSILKPLAGQEKREKPGL